MIILILAILLGLIPAFIASNKGRGFITWWLFGAALFIVALPMALIMKKTEAQATFDEKLRKCPFCAESIKQEAVVCKHCGKEVVAESTKCTCAEGAVPSPYSNTCGRCGKELP